MRLSNDRYLYFVVACAAALRLGLAAVEHSIFWPDEIYQSLEEAHRAAFGYGIIPWEFRDGARSWVFPGAIAALWKAAASLGVESSLALVVIARSCMAGLSVLALWAAAQLAKALKGETAALCAAAALLLFPASVVFSYRAMSETASAPLVALGFWFYTRSTSRSAGLAGLCLAAASLLRYQNALLAATCLLLLITRLRYKDAFVFALAGCAVAACGGLLDWVTWGRPFHSLLVYIEFNLLTDGASGFGTEPVWFYLEYLVKSTGIAFWPLASALALGALRVPWLGGVIAIYFAAHSVIPHKELRFLVPCFPLAAALVGTGAADVFERLTAKARGVFAALGVLVLGACGYSLWALTYARMGQYLGSAREASSVWRSEQDVNILLAEVGRRSDLCGLGVLGQRAAFTGGYTYLHRPVRLLYGSALCDHAAEVNYVIRSLQGPEAELPREYDLLETRGALGLFRRPGTCDSRQVTLSPYLEGASGMGLYLQQAVQRSDGSLAFDLIEDAGSFRSGWGNGEIIDCAPARWAAAKRAELRFVFHPGNHAYALVASLRAFERAWPQRMRIEVNERPVHDGPVALEFGTLRVELEPGVLQDGTNHVAFLFDSVSKPPGDDPRELAALFNELHITSVSDDFTVEVGKDGFQRHLVAGFNGLEFEAQRAFVWNDGAVSELVGTLAKPAGPYLLQALGQAIPLLPTQVTEVFVNDLKVGTLEFKHYWSRLGLLVPRSALRDGENRIRFVYAATVRPGGATPGSNDERELAVRFQSMSLAPVGAATEIDFGTSASHVFLLDGWSEDEREGDRTAVWTTGKIASLAVRLPHSNRLSLWARAFHPAAPLQVHLQIDRNPVGAFSVGEAWSKIELALPANSTSDQVSVLAFLLGATARPAEVVPGSRDTRELGLRVDRLRFEAPGVE